MPSAALEMGQPGALPAQPFQNCTATTGRVVGWLSLHDGTGCGAVRPVDVDGPGYVSGRRRVKIAFEPRHFLAYGCSQAHYPRRVNQEQAKFRTASLGTTKCAKWCHGI